MAANNVVECLNLFQTYNLDVKWVNEVFENDFADLDELPVGLEELEWRVILSETCAATRLYISQIRKAGNKDDRERNKSFSERSNDVNRTSNTCQLEEEEEDSTLWALLIKEGVNVKGILIIVLSILNVGSKSTATVEERDLGITAAGFYLNFVCSPSANAFQLFQPTLYKKVLDFFRLYTELLSQEDAATTPSLSKRTKNSSNGTKQRRDNLERDEEETLEDESQQQEAVQFSREQICCLMKRLSELTNDLKVFLCNFCLKCPTSLDLTIERMCYLVQKCPTINGNSDRGEWELSSRCFELMTDMCHTSQNIFDVAVIIFKYLTEPILNCSNRNLVNFVCNFIDRVPPEDISEAVCMLIQNLCCRSPEKADFRVKVSGIVLVLMNRLVLPDYIAMIKWLTGPLSSSKAGLRVLAVELMHFILGRSTLPVTEDIDPRTLHFVSKSFILERIVLACSDKAPLVRSKALSLLATCVNDVSPEIKQAVASMLNNSCSTPVRQELVEADNGSKDVENNEEGLSEAESVVVNWQTISNLLTRRLIDTNVFVRKAAIQVLQNTMTVYKTCVSLESVKSLRGRCCDVAVSVRKQALQALSSLLLTYPDIEYLYPEWLEGVLMAGLDHESSIQEKCMEMVAEVIFDNISAFPSSSRDSLVAWNVLNLIIKRDREEGSYAHCLQKMIAMLSDGDRLRNNLICILKTHLNTVNSNSAWLLMSMLTSHLKNLKLDFVWDYWSSNVDILCQSETPLIWVLHIMGVAATKLQSSRVTEYANQLTTILVDGKCPIYAIPVIVDTLANFSGKLRDVHSGESILHTSCEIVLRSCSEFLAASLLDKNADPRAINDELVAKNLILLGEMGQLRPKLVPKRMLLLIKSSLVMNSQLGVEGPNTQNQLTRLDFMKRLPHFAYLSLGKLCLLFEDLAKECIPAVGHELANSKLVSVRRTIIFIMADLCVRYGTLVDSFLPVVIGCLRDPSEVVRCDAMTLLTQLLQEDYLKWRGSLYFAFIITLVDESPKIQMLAKYTLNHVLKKRHPKIFSMHFIECMFFFNAYQIKKGNGPNMARVQKDSKLFSVTGQRDKRMVLYKFMLENMSDDERIQTTSRLCKDILNEVIEGRIVLRQTNGRVCCTGEELVRDTLIVLRSDEMRFTHLKNPEDGGEEVGDSGMEGSGAGVQGTTTSAQNAALAAARKAVLSQYIKKNTVDIIVPILLACKRKFEEQKSSLLKELILYLRDVMKTYKNELKDILAEDKRLMAELEFDMKKLEQYENDPNASFSWSNGLVPRVSLVKIDCLYQEIQQSQGSKSKMDDNNSVVTENLNPRDGAVVVPAQQMTPKSENLNPDERMEQNRPSPRPPLGSFRRACSSISENVMETPSIVVSPNHQSINTTSNHKLVKTRRSSTNNNNINNHQRIIGLKRAKIVIEPLREGMKRYENLIVRSPPLQTVSTSPVIILDPEPPPPVNVSDEIESSSLTPRILRTRKRKLPNVASTPISKYPGKNFRPFNVSAAMSPIQREQ